ncbi:MAG TPA: SDR family oxidoreductase [Pyrinomonadaceae bacterium]|jgi:acyl transferase domain-containing protein/acyl carrier protein
MTSESVEGVAIVGIACRFPGANNPAEFWSNLARGVESLRTLTDEELLASGVNPSLLSNPNYIKVNAVLDDVEMFDASFFGYSPREAEIMDPQHRFFLECAWEALERAGCDPAKTEGEVGVFAGVGSNSYLVNLYSHPELIEAVGGLQIKIGNDKDHLATRVSYKLNLRGPSLTVQSSCSTSLVAVHMACQALQNYECDVALAGGVTIVVPQKIGYLYVKGGVASADGHCRAFDARGEGPVGGSGVGVVALKRLSDALADGDHIHAVIRGSAINNDGMDKVGYSAPGVRGQAEVIAMAQSLAGVEPDSVTYVEAHGTGTKLGDPIEVAALTRAFRAGTERRNFCALGSVKTNFGHLDAAAGVAGLIKAALSLEHRAIPPSLNFESPNPDIDFDNSPFYVNTRLADWPEGETPRRAGVSSFGMGGTNAHVILEEAPAVEQTPPARSHELLLLSAKTEAALDRARAALAAHLRERPGTSLADAAYTLRVGRKEFGRRLAAVCANADEAAAALEQGRVLKGAGEADEPRPVIFMFPGVGTQYVGMGADLYREEPAYREHLDACAELLRPRLGLDLRDFLFPAPGRAAEAEAQLRQARLLMPAVFSVSYALARLLTSWGVQPRAMIGHSLGEYAAACLSGVLSLEDALALVALRGSLLSRLPAGGLLSVSLPEGETRALMGGELSLAVVNAPNLCSVAGPSEAVEAFAALLRERGAEFKRVHVDAAVHSSMVEPVVDEFVRAVEAMRLQAPQIPYVSNVTGDWITAEEATDPRYWGRHLRETVRFEQGLRAATSRERGAVLLEVGPGTSLNALVKMQGEASRPAAVNTMRHPYERQSDVAVLLTALGRLWTSGVEVDWTQFHAGEGRRRVPLPTYPFERERYWVAPAARPAQGEPGVGAPAALAAGRSADVGQWFYLPSWKVTMPPAPFRAGGLRGESGAWLVFDDAQGWGDGLVKLLTEEGQEVSTVAHGAEFEAREGHAFVINPRRQEDYERLAAELNARGRMPDRVVHLWSVEDEEGASGYEYFERCAALGFQCLVSLTQASAGQGVRKDVQLLTVTRGLHDVAGGGGGSPERMTVLGPCRVIPQEYPNVSCRNIDFGRDEAAGGRRDFAARLLAEILSGSAEGVVAYRGRGRYVQTFEQAPLGGDAPEVRPLREGGVYLITGGLGRVGLLLAEHLARSCRARLVLTARAAPPPRDEWPRLVKEGGEWARKVRGLLALEEAGAEVLTAAVDVADEGQMRALLEKVEERFGALDGVIHAAAAASGESVAPVLELQREAAARVFRPKAGGLYVLEKLLRGRELDFCVAFSSNAAILGGPGFAAYAAANLFVDAFAAREGSADAGAPRWMSANWDGWAVEEDEVPQEPRLRPAHVMSPREGAEAFRRVVTRANTSRVIVSPGNLFARARHWLEPESRQEGGWREQLEGSHRRPELQSEYAAPTNEIEQSVAAIWGSLFGIERVGVHDNFFDLGGHSLLATQVVSRLHESFNVEVSIRSFFERPTVAELSAHIEDLLLEEIEALPEEEVEQLIKRES